MTSFLHVDLHIAADWKKKNNDNISQTISFLLLSIAQGSHNKMPFAIK
jgi:hypothetical protein